MNRYQSYTPISLNYKPHTPNFDKWYEILDGQQKRFDTFNQSLNMLNSTSELDPEHSKAWNSYLNTTKDQVKSAYKDGVGKGNEFLRGKLDEVAKQATSGLYKDIETRKQEFSLESASYNEKMKDQSSHRQNYYAAQWNYKKPMYNEKGNLNHITGPNITKDPLLDKMLIDFSKNLKPEEIETKVQKIRYAKDEAGEPINMINDKGQFTGSGQWIDSFYQYSKGIKKEDFDVLISDYISSNPDFVEDVHIRVWNQEKMMNPESKEIFKAAYMNQNQEKVDALTNVKNLVLSGKDSKTGELMDSHTITLLNRQLLNIDSDEFSSELKEKIGSKYDKHIEAIQNKNKNFNLTNALFEENLKNFSGSMYHYVEHSEKSSSEFAINPDYQMRWENNADMMRDQINNRVKMAMNEADNANARYIANQKINADKEAATLLRQNADSELPQGLPTNQPTTVAAISPVTLFNQSKEAAVNSEKALKSSISKLNLGHPTISKIENGMVTYSNGKTEKAPALNDLKQYQKSYNENITRMNDASNAKMSNNIYESGKKLNPKLALERPSVIRSTLQTNGFNIQDSDDPYVYLKSLNEFKTSYEQHKTLSNQYQNIDSKLNKSGVITKMDTWMKDKYETYKKDMKYQGSAPVSYDAFANEVTNGNFSYSIEGSSYSSPTTGVSGTTRSKINVSEIYRNKFEKEITGLSGMLPRDYNVGHSFINDNPKSIVNIFKEQSLMPAISRMIENGSQLKDPTKDSAAVFMKKNDKGEYNVVSNAEAMKAYRTAKAEKTLNADIITVAGKPAYNISYTTKEGGTYIVTTKAPESHIGHIQDYARKHLDESSANGDVAGQSSAAQLFLATVNIQRSPFVNDHDYNATDITYRDVEGGSHHGKVMNELNYGGLNFGVIKQGDQYMSGLKQDGQWQLINIGDDIITDTDPLDVSTQTAIRLLQRNKVKVSGTNKAFNSQDEDEID